jgi:hypothetical protein
MRTHIQAGLLILLMATAGCGSLTGGTGGSSGGGNGTYPLATTTRLLQPNDSWTYTITGGTAVNISTGTSTNVTGTLTQTISSTSTNGASLANTQVYTLITSAGLPISWTTVVYMTQNTSTGVLSEVGDTNGPGNALRLASTPTEILPGGWASTTSFNTSLTYTNGETAKDTFTVTGTTTAAATIGSATDTFNVWTVSNVSGDSLGNQSSMTAAYAPEMGNVIQFSSTITTVNAGYVLTLTGVLTSTTVPVS